MKRIVVLVTLTFCLAVAADAQDILVIEGGNRTQPDPKDKKLIQAIAENEGLRLTLGKSHLWKHKRAQMIGVYLKVENLSDKPLSVRPGNFSAVAADGKAFAGLSTEDAIKHYNDTHGIATAALVGPFMNPVLQARVAESFRREGFPAGDVPPHSYKEGVIFFEGPKEQYYTMKVVLTGLWPGLFLISTEKSKR